ncbi:phosphatase 2C-like domain-containing protein [Podospora didyma]|uniref:Phosphatase 2C-like domain-containing protein n=1 Tax=Podospora didyma TaxID=330526 RepID=A0AAE0KFJ8_9PEZI|nr:phosphatase 2C-like domain-containing protein [Podospora didyma]
MFGGGSNSAVPKSESSSIAESTTTISSGLKEKSSSKVSTPDKEKDKDKDAATPPPLKTTDLAASGEKRSGNGSPPSASSSAEQKKRRSSGVSGRASNLIAQAKNTLFTQAGSRTNPDQSADSKLSNQTPLQKLGKQDQALAVPQGQHNNAAGESLPGPRSTFRVGVWEDRNKKCRRTMEDTHAFLYNFLHTPAPALGAEGVPGQRQKATDDSGEAQRGPSASTADMIETDNGYFAIFDGHAGTFAADWCGKKLHIILEEVIRKNPNAPIPELLDQTFTTVDTQLEKLPLKNSGCTAAVAVLRWEDRVPSTLSATGSQAIAPAVAKAAEEASKSDESKSSETALLTPNPEAAHARLKGTATRQRVLYTANVGDARIILCRSGKALRLSYDHKGSDENEGRRIANAGGLILNNRVNGVLAVTRALGDTYMKDLVTGHPYTTETVIQPELDEFIIIACDGLWDVCTDQEAVDLIRTVQEPVSAAKILVDHALARFSTDNLSCMIVRFDKNALLDNQNNKDNAIGVEGDAATASGKVSEVEKIVSATKQKIAEGGTPPLGVSASNSGRGHDPAPIEDGDSKTTTTFTPTLIEGSVEEEPSFIDVGGPRANASDAKAVASSTPSKSKTSPDASSKGGDEVSPPKSS